MTGWGSSSRDGPCRMGQLEMVGEGEGTVGRREHDSAREQAAGVRVRLESRGCIPRKSRVINEAGGAWWKMLGVSSRAVRENKRCLSRRFEVPHLYPSSLCDLGHVNWPL